MFALAQYELYFTVANHLQWDIDCVFVIFKLFIYKLLLFAYVCDKGAKIRALYFGEIVCNVEKNILRSTIGKLFYIFYSPQPYNTLSTAKVNGCS